MNRAAALSALILSASVSSVAFAVTPPASEQFTAGASGWTVGSSGPALASWSSNIGPDGSGAISTQRSFVNDPVSTTNPPVLFSALSGASGNALFGDWIAAGVTQFSFDIRHNAPVALSAFARFAGAGNFPGAIAVGFVPVQPNTWTTVTISIAANSSNFVSFEGTNFATVFGPSAPNGFQGIGRLQLGILVPQALAFTTPTYQFDIDNVRVIPTPSVGAMGLLAGGALFGARRRRR